MRAISRIAPSFAVRGNWDSRNWSRIDIFHGTGFQELNGRSKRVVIRDVPLRVVGMSADNPYLLPFALRTRTPEEYTVLLFHFPDILQQAVAQNVDLYL